MLTAGIVVAVANVLAWGLSAFKHYQVAQKIKSIAAANAPRITTVVNQGEKLVANVLDTPEFAKLKAELEHAESKLRDSQLVHIVGTVLRAADKRLTELTPNQKTALSLVVITAAKKIGLPNVTQTEVFTIMNVVDKALDEVVNNSLFQSTRDIDTEVASSTEPVVDQTVAPMPATVPQA